MPCVCKRLFCYIFAKRKGSRQAMEVFKMATLWTCAHTLIIAWAVVFVLSSSLLITSCRPKAERVIVFLCRVSFVESDPVMVDLSWFVESGQRYLAVAFVRLTCLWFPCSSELLSRRFNVISCDEWFRLCFLYLLGVKNRSNLLMLTSCVYKCFALLNHLRGEKVCVGRW